MPEGSRPEDAGQAHAGAGGDQPRADETSETEPLGTDGLGIDAMEGDSLGLGKEDDTDSTERRSFR